MDTMNLVYIHFYVSLDTRSDKLAHVINNFRRNFSHCFWTIILYQVFLAGSPVSIRNSKYELSLQEKPFHGLQSWFVFDNHNILG